MYILSVLLCVIAVYIVSHLHNTDVCERNGAVPFSSLAIIEPADQGVLRNACSREERELYYSARVMTTEAREACRLFSFFVRILPFTPTNPATFKSIGIRSAGKKKRETTKSLLWLTHNRKVHFAVQSIS